MHSTASRHAAGRVSPRHRQRDEPRRRAVGAAGAGGGDAADAGAPHAFTAAVSGAAPASADASFDASLRSGPLVRVVGAPDLESERTTERAVLDLAWVVKQCAPWTVPARTH